MPAASFLRRHSRLLRMAELIDADSTTEPDDIARKLGIGRRTLYRDLDLLRRAGIRLVFCREENRYRLDSLYMRLAMGLTQKEAAAFLKWSSRRAKRAQEPPRPFDRALQKISRILSDELNAVRKPEPKI